MTEDEDEIRRRGVVAEARRLMKGPSVALTVVGVVQILAAAGMWGLGKGLGHMELVLVGILLVTPGPILLLGGRQIRRLLGWNLVFGGLLVAVVLWLLGFFALSYVGLGVLWTLPLALVAFHLGLVVWMARLAENPHVMLARSLVDPQPERDPMDRGVF